MINDIEREMAKIESSRPYAGKSQKINDLPDFLSKTGTVPGQQLFSLHDALAEFCKEKKIMLFKPAPYIDFIPPKLTEGKDWYISYYVRDPRTGAMKRIRMKVNRPKAARERRRIAREMMAAIQARLALGWNPLYAADAPKAGESLHAALEAFLRIKGKEMETQSFRSYASYVRVFRSWLESTGMDGTALCCTVTRETARDYLDYLENKEGISPRTYNNYLSFQSVLWEWMKEKGYAAENVFRAFKKKPKRMIKKTRRLLEPEEISRLFDFLSEKNPSYMAVALLCYCCFIRPKEIALLRCEDIDLAQQRVRVRAEIAKNDNESYRTIPDSVMPVFRKLDLSRPELFVFGRHDGSADDFSPGPEPVSEKKFSDYWKTAVRPACGFGMDLKLYSLKDTGITGMLSEGIPINQVQRQADHSSVAMTAIYVGKSMSVDEQIRKINLAGGTTSAPSQ